MSQFQARQPQPRYSAAPTKRNFQRPVQNPGSLPSLQPVPSKGPHPQTAVRTRSNIQAAGVGAVESAQLARAGDKNDPAKTKPRVEHKILFQTYFKSAGPRTYAAQVKEATNGNHYIVLTEAQRDKQTNELRKRTICVFSEDFEALSQLMGQTFAFLEANPLPDDFRKSRREFWSKRSGRTPQRSGQPRGK